VTRRRLTTPKRLHFLHDFTSTLGNLSAYFVGLPIWANKIGVFARAVTEVQA